MPKLAVLIGAVVLGLFVVGCGSNANGGVVPEPERQTAAEKARQDTQPGPEAVDVNP
ncbi:MAG: hypothetical protein SNJ74_02695 [Fimbriimonadaceae bacterium]